ncbi:uncharacterized protein C1orf112 homolog isoform X2 [Cryptotermes secundus]|uniref:uncharacterized protein C1orf112 homolog isoform X2 n=1 Tax=Cryptotermes secundus TaxID=105785 RepID=UPI000CD7D4FA|nr:uncharacterized protein C1orf112 homolog isoform X2 [Cryptotermes secundus]
MRKSRILEFPDQKALSLQALQALLSKCLPCIPVNDVEEKLFQYALPSTRQLFNETLEGICTRLQDAQTQQCDKLLDSVNSLLQVCTELLTCIDSALHYVLRSGKVDAALVPSLPKVAVHILYEAFKHCKESEKMYGALFQPVGDALTSLFQKSRELQLHFLEVVSENLQFRCTYEAELELLTEILDMLGEIGQLVMDLDVKTMAEQWKGYARLAFQYVDHLKPRLDVAGPLRFLAADVSRSLKSVIEVDQPDMKFITRTVKVGNFALKIIIKLCDQYSGFLGPCHDELFKMLLTAYRYSSPYLRMKNVPKDVIQNVETHMTIGAEPLLAHLVAEVEFTEKVIAYVDKLAEAESERLAFLLLSVSILKKLLHCSQAVRKLWLGCNSELNILSVLFRTLGYCHAEMSWDLQFPGVSHSDEPQRMTDLYEYTVTHVAAFVMSTSAQEFLSVEHVLIASVMQPAVWRALLSMDVWCIVARSGSSELCFQQLCHLIEVMKHLVHHHGRPEKTYVTVLAGRLFPLLPNKHKVQIVEMFPPDTDLCVWQALSVKALPEKLKAAVTESLVRAAILHTERLLTLPASPELYSHMVDILAAASQCVELLTPNERDMLSAITGHVVTLWQRVALNELLTAEETSVKGFQWINHFVSVLCSLSAPLTLHMSNSQLIQVLVRLKDIIACGSSAAKLKVVTILNRLADTFVDSTPDQMQVFQHIAGLFASLLLDENQIVQQMTLETFTYFAHVNSHECILALSVKNNENLQRKTRTYLQKLPVKASIENFLSLESYIKCQSEVKFSHSCKTSVTERESVADTKLIPKLELHTSEEIKSIDHLPKRQKVAVTEDSVIKAIERLKYDTGMVVRFCESSSLPVEAKQEVLKVAVQLNTLVSALN